MPAVRRPGRRHDARRGHRHGRAEAPRRRRARRRRDLRRRSTASAPLATASARASTPRCPPGQARALASAYAKAGLRPDTVELVEAHGTGTVAGDAAEFGGLERVFDGTDRDRPAVVRARLGEVADRPHQGRRRRGGADQGRAWRCTTRCCRRRSRSTGRTRSSTCEQSPFYLNTEHAAVGARRRTTRGAGRSARSASADRTSTRARRSTRDPARARRGCGPPTPSWSCSADPSAADRDPQARAPRRRGHARRLPAPPGPDEPAGVSTPTRRRASRSSPTDEADLRAKLGAGGRADRQRSRDRSPFDESPDGIALRNRAAPRVTSRSSSRARAASTCSWARTSRCTSPRRIGAWDLAADHGLGRRRAPRRRLPDHVVRARAPTASTSRCSRATQWAQPAIGATSLATAARAAMRSALRCAARRRATASARSPRCTPPACCRRPT